MVSTEFIELVAISVVGVAAFTLGLFEYLHRFRLRRLRELRDEGKAPQLASDRAYNRLALARREADLLDAQGGEVERARQLIDLADRSMQGRDFDRAYQLAQSAHETLVRSRREPARAGPLPSRTSAAAPTTGGAATGPVETPPPSANPSPSPTIPKNRAEAQFQLRLFEQELAEGTKSGATDREVGEARTLYVQAHAAFSRADYAESFRLALRGRRTVGARVESLGPPPPGARAPSAGVGASVDPADSAAQVAARARCPDCGHPTVPGDAFCRGCGAARTPTACPKCGAERTPADAFCGRCGERYTVVATVRRA